MWLEYGNWVLILSNISQNSREQSLAYCMIDDLISTCDKCA